MPKYEKNLSILLILLSLSSIIGLAITKLKALEIIFSQNTTILNLLEFIVVITLFLYVIHDVYNIYYGYKKFGIAKFKVTITTKNRLKLIINTFTIVSLLQLIILINFPNVHMLILYWITLMLILILLLHNRFNNGISDNGILYCGIYHSWDDVKSHEFKNETSLEMTILIKFFSFEYTNIVKFIFDPKDKIKINQLLLERL